MLKEWIDGKWVERESLLAALGLVESSVAFGGKPEKKPEKNRVISIVAQAEKPPACSRFQLECEKLGILAAAGTTTHIQYEKNTGFLDRPDLQAARDMLKKTGTLWMGEPVSDWKCKALPERFYRELLAEGIWLLLEADGAREKPVKAPREGEPVILPEDRACALCVWTGGSGAAYQRSLLPCGRGLRHSRKRREGRPDGGRSGEAGGQSGRRKKGRKTGMDYAVLFNKADTREREAAALEAAKAACEPETRILMAADLMPPWKLQKAGETG